MTTKDKQWYEQEIAHIQKRIKSISESLPYAEGRQYFDEQKDLTELKLRLIKVQEEFKQLNL